MFRTSSPTPALTPLNPGDAFADLVGLTADERARLTELNEQLALDYAGQLDELFAKLSGKAPPSPPGTPAWAKIRAFESVLEGAVPADIAAVRAQIAAERAGKETQPSDEEMHPFERYIRTRANLGDWYEDHVARELGPGTRA